MPPMLDLRFLALGAVLALAGCAGREDETVTVSRRAHDCMTRAMFFESNRSSRDGMVAVGTVVMNRVASDDFPDTVCEVVGQRNQFAPGVMSRAMRSPALPLAQATALAVLAGERHPMIEAARFFHAATYRAGYNNMHYVATAGGNAFYERRPPELVTQPVPLPNVEGLTGGG